jgi:hypothetical protein
MLKALFCTSLRLAATNRSTGLDNALKNSTLRADMPKNLWIVKLSRKADKSMERMPKLIVNALALLMSDIEAGGPVRGDWPNYSAWTAGVTIAI